MPGQLVRRLKNPLEWESSTKGTVLLVVTFLMQLGYVGWTYQVIERPGLAEVMNVPFVRQQLPVMMGILQFSLVLTLLLFVCRRLFGDHSAYEYIAALYYAQSHIYYAWLIGTLTLPVGIVLAGAPVLGFIFFNRMAVVVSFCSSCVVLIAVTLLSASGQLPYAPALNPVGGAGGGLGLFVALSFIMFSVPHVCFLFGMAYLVLRRWREREEEVRVMSRIDPLTGMFNRRSILTQLKREQDRSVEQGLPMAVVMLDLDHFKRINDSWGHEAGDYVLIAASDVLQKIVRQNDRVGRYGGEEFLLVLPGADTEGARRLAERCRQQIEALEVLLSDGRRIRVSVSMGLYCNENDRRAATDTMLRRADKALYAAKETGRNRIVVADESFA